MSTSKAPTADEWLQTTLLVLLDRFGAEYMEGLDPATDQNLMRKSCLNAAKRIRQFQSRCTELEEELSAAYATYTARISELEAENAALRERLESEERSHSITVDQREHAEGIANKLASAIGEYFGFDIGEHSSANCPWENALDGMPPQHQEKGECEHGNGLTDYCEPCGRIHNG